MASILPVPVALVVAQVPLLVVVVVVVPVVVVVVVVLLMLVVEVTVETTTTTTFSTVIFISQVPSWNMAAQERRNPSGRGVLWNLVVSHRRLGLFRGSPASTEL